MSRSNTRQVLPSAALPFATPAPRRGYGAVQIPSGSRSSYLPVLFFLKTLSKMPNSLLLPLFAQGIKLRNGRFLELQSRFMAGALLRAGVRYHSLPSTAATTACDREAAHKWSREGKHLFGASRYTDHPQIAQLVPDFSLALFSDSQLGAAGGGAGRRDLRGEPGTASHRPCTRGRTGCGHCLTQDGPRKPGQALQQA